MKKYLSIMICLVLLPLFGCGSSPAAAGAPVQSTAGASAQSAVEAPVQNAAGESAKSAVEAPVQSTAGESAQDMDFTMAIAWTDNPEAYSYKCMNITAGETGEYYIRLDMVRSYDLTYDDKGMLVDAVDEHGILTPEAAGVVKENTWMNSNVEELMEDVDCIIFPGGKDICPTLYCHEQPWHGIEKETEYSAERDVSDYLLMDYCLDNDIPVLAICRGMQMLAVVSGADMIQDIPAWLTDQGIQYTDIHRDPEKKDMVPHPVRVLSKNSLLYEITGQTLLNGCPSWHHQIVGDVTGTGLTVVAEADTNGITTIEVVERKDRTFCLGLQFHPEVAVGKIVNNEANAGDFLDYDTAMSFFRALIEKAKEYEEEELKPAA